MTFYLVTIILIGFIIRIIPRLKLPDYYASDTCFHLYCAEFIRKLKFQIPQEIPRVLLPHRYSYPYFYHMLLAIFPLRSRLWAERLSSALFDSLSSLVIFYFCIWFFNFSDKTESILNASLVTALFSFSPALLRIGSGPRAYNGSPRPFGLFLYILHITTLCYSLVNHSVGFFIVSLVSAALIFISAKFATQTLLFFGLVISCLCFPLYSGVIILAIIISFIFSMGKIVSILQGSLLHSINYYLNLQSVFLFPHFRRDKLKSYFCQWLTVKGLFSPHINSKERKKRIGAFVEWYYSENYFLHLLLTVFPQFLLIGYFMLKWPILSPTHFLLLTVMGAGLLFFLVTKMKPLLFLGEGERYLEYALFPSLLLTVSFIHDHHWIIYIFLIYSLVSVPIFIRLFYKLFQDISFPDFFERRNICQRIISDVSGNILPVGPFHWFCLLFTKNPVLTHGANFRPDEHDSFNRVFSYYPLPSSEFQGIIKDWNIRYIVSNQIWIQKYQNDVIGNNEEFDKIVEWIYQSNLFWIGQIKMCKNKAVIS